MLIAPLSVGRPSSVQLIDDAVSASQRVIGVVAQRESEQDEPGIDDVYGVGCAVIIHTLMKTGEGSADCSGHGPVQGYGPDSRNSVP